jgi:hypothetical protein
VCRFVEALPQRKKSAVQRGIDDAKRQDGNLKARHKRILARCVTGNGVFLKVNPCGPGVRSGKAYGEHPASYKSSNAVCASLR